jgi:hypothetical protein
MTLGRQTLYKSLLSAMTENRVIDVVIESSNSTNDANLCYKGLIDQRCNQLNFKNLLNFLLLGFDNFDIFFSTSIFEQISCSIHIAMFMYK